MLQRLVVALVADQRIVPPGQALGETRRVGDIGQHPAQRQVQVEGRELVRRGQDIVRSVLAPSMPQPVGSEDPAASPRRPPRAGSASAGPGPPTTARSSRASRPCPPRRGAGGTPGPARGSAGSAAARSSAQGRSPTKLAGSRSPCAPIAAGASRASSSVSPTLIIQTSTASDAPWVRTGFMVSETKISRRPTETCARTEYVRSGRMLSGIEADVEGEGRVARARRTVARPSSVAGASATLTSSSTTSSTAPGGSAISSR